MNGQARAPEAKEPEVRNDSYLDDIIKYSRGIPEIAFDKKQIIINGVYIEGVYAVPINFEIILPNAIRDLEMRPGVLALNSIGYYCMVGKDTGKVYKISRKKFLPEGKGASEPKGELIVLANSEAKGFMRMVNLYCM